MSKKQFILDTLLPYFADPTTCGYNTESGSCMYLAPNGNQCAAGKHILPEYANSSQSITGLIMSYGMDVFTPEARSMDLSKAIWQNIQDVHDQLANRRLVHTQDNINELEGRLEEPLPELLEALNGLVERGDWFVSGSGTED